MPYPKASDFEIMVLQYFNNDVFIFKLRTRLEVDFLNLCLCVQTQKYT